MENLIKRAIAHFDKKITDYQLYVDKEVQKQSSVIKTLKNYLKNTLDSFRALITEAKGEIDEKTAELEEDYNSTKTALENDYNDFKAELENSAGSGSGGSEKKFTLISDEITAVNDTVIECNGLTEFYIKDIFRTTFGVGNTSSCVSLYIEFENGTTKSIQMYVGDHDYRLCYVKVKFIGDLLTAQLDTEAYIYHFYGDYFYVINSKIKRLRFVDETNVGDIHVGNIYAR